MDAFLPGRDWVGLGNGACHCNGYCNNHHWLFGLEHIFDSSLPHWHTGILALKSLHIGTTSYAMAASSILEFVILTTWTCLLQPVMQNGLFKQFFFSQAVLSEIAQAASLTFCPGLFQVVNAAAPPLYRLLYESSYGCPWALGCLRFGTDERWLHTFDLCRFCYKCEAWNSETLAVLRSA